MQLDRSIRPRAARAVVAVGVSLCVHLLALALLRPPEPPDTVVVTTLVEEPPAPQAPVDDREPSEAADAASEPSASPPPVARPAEESPPPVVAVVVEPPPAPQPVSPPEETLRSVAQHDRNTPAPDHPEYLAEVDNSTLVETMAREVTLFDEAPEPDAASQEEARDEERPESGEQDAVLSQAVAPADVTEIPIERAPEPVDARVEERATALGAPDGADETADRQPAEAREEIVADSDEGVADQVGHDTGDRTTEAVEVQDGPGLGSLLPQIAVVQARAIAASQAAPVARGDRHGVDAEAYVEVFGSRDAQERGRVEREAQRASLVGDHDARWERTRASLENFDVHVTPGTETSLNTRSDAVAGYIHYLHNKIHPEWWDYLARLDLSFGPIDPLSDLSLVTLVEFGISREGEVDTVNVVDGSGVLSFDAEAIDLLYEIGPHRAPPPGMLSSDGRAYLLWTFHRDNRGCATWGASAHRIQTSEGEDG